jgi:hypothetical protein
MLYLQFLPSPSLLQLVIGILGKACGHIGRVALEVGALPHQVKQLGLGRQVGDAFGDELLVGAVQPRLLPNWILTLYTEYNIVNSLNPLFPRTVKHQRTLY